MRKEGQVSCTCSIKCKHTHILQLHLHSRNEINNNGDEYTNAERHTAYITLLKIETHMTHSVTRLLTRSHTLTHSHQHTNMHTDHSNSCSSSTCSSSQHLWVWRRSAALEAEPAASDGDPLLPQLKLLSEQTQEAHQQPTHIRRLI